MSVKGVTRHIFNKNVTTFPFHYFFISLFVFRCFFRFSDVVVFCSVCVCVSLYVGVYFLIQQSDHLTTFSKKERLDSFHPIENVSHRILEAVR